jgi:hypothetical protein
MRITRTGNKRDYFSSLTSVSEVVKHKVFFQALVLLLGFISAFIDAGVLLSQVPSFQFRSGKPVWLFKGEVVNDQASDIRMRGLTSSINQSMYNFEYGHKSGWTISLGSGQMQQRFRVELDSIENQYHGWFYFEHAFRSMEYGLGYRFYSKQPKAHWFLKFTYSHQKRYFPSRSNPTPLGTVILYPGPNPKGLPRYVTEIPDQAQQHWNMVGMHLERQLHYKNRFRLSYILGCQVGLQDFDRASFYYGSPLPQEIGRMSINMVYPSVSVKLGYSLQGIGATLGKTWNKFTDWLII